MKLKKEGIAPFKTALIHGGPGAAKELSPISKKLSETVGVIEPYQTAYTINGQINELKNILQDNSYSPITVVGYSWGAWLSMMTAARHPKLIKKLILIGTPPLTTEYADTINKTRQSRLDINSKKRIDEISNKLHRSTDLEKERLFIEMGQVFDKSDIFEQGYKKASSIDYSVKIFHEVWREAEEFRKKNGLIKIAKLIKCPISIIHGEYDPHPIDGIVKPLSKIIPNIKLYPLKKCGHTPWIEKYARDKFFQILLDEISK